jgi:ferric-dicitrate binding protein FerR (iron transport regulator)
METERYIALIHRKLSNQISDSDRIELENWYRESPENAELYEEVRALWQSLQPQESGADFNLQQSWDSLELALGLQDAGKAQIYDLNKHRHKWNRFPASQSLRYWVAAAVLLVIISVLTLMQYQGTDQSLRYITKNGENRIYDLPDGSSVHLNNASEVKVENHFGISERRVKLTGEAFFEIKRDTIPFVVATANAEIRVLGTSFYVQSIAQETKVVVSCGTVAFLNRDKNTEPGIILTANQASHCAGEMPAQPPQEVDANDFLGWREGKLIYKERSLAEIILDLERTYNIAIETSGSVSTTGVVSGWFFKDEGPEYILRTICSTLGYKISQKNKTFVITNEV